MTLRIYNSKEVKVVFAGVPVRGYADGDFLSIERINDLYSSTAGADAEVARAAVNDNRATIEIRLLQTSPTSAAFSAIFQADIRAPGGAGVGAFLCADLSGASLYTAGNAWIKKPPTVTMGREVNEVVWTLECDNLIDFTGGNL